MSDRVPIFAHGTARALFESQTTGEAIDQFFRKLAIGAAHHDLGDDSLYLCEELVRLPWSLAPAQRRSLALLVLATFVAARQGSSRLPLGGGASGYLGQIVSSIVKVSETGDTTARIIREIGRMVSESRFDALIGGPDDDKPLVYANGCIYQQRLYASERRLAGRLRARLATVAPETAEAGRAVAAVAERAAVAEGRRLELSDEQKRAAERALAGRFAVISGGPGTGKTATVTSILRAAVRLGRAPDELLLAAPTGKAAQRLGESLRRGLSVIAEPSDADRALAEELPVPQTLHRLLGYVPSLDQFRHHEGNPIRAGLILVDEASMIDLALMEQLARSLHQDTPLVLLGDADQLPSVDAGSVFRDLVTLGDSSGDFGDFARRLTVSYRMDRSDPAGNAIYRASQAINEGVSSYFDENVQVHRSPSRVDWKGVEIASGEPTPLLEAWYQKYRRSPEVRELTSRVYLRASGRFAPDSQRDIDRLFELYGRSRILATTRRLGRGSLQLNARLHELALADSSTISRPDFLPGTAIQATANDYRREIYNGDQGIVLRVDEDGAGQHYRAVFPRGEDYVVFHLDALRSQLEHSSAMTVHKSQGSEYDDVFIVFPDVDLPLLTRELLYTAITRARRSVVISARPSQLTAAIRRRVVRHSGVAELLRP